MTRPYHILVVRFSAMGDVAMTVPVIRALLSQNPQLKITILTKPFFAPIYKSLPNVSVFAADLKGRHKGVKGLYLLSKEIRQLKIEAVADLHNVLRTRILRLFLKGLPFNWIDKGRADKKALTSGQVFEQLKTTHERYADVFKHLGFQVDLNNPTFPHERRPLPNCLKDVDNSRKLLGIAPFAAHSAKMYPLDLMQVVIEDLSARYNLVLFGGSEEGETLSKIAKKYQHTVSIAGKVTFEDELSLISNLDLMVSMDSGNGHLAALYGIKVLTIWGVTHPYAGFAPFYQPMNNSLMADREKYPLQFMVISVLKDMKMPQDQSLHGPLLIKSMSF